MAATLPWVTRRSGSVRENVHVTTPLTFPGILTLEECDAVVALGGRRLRYQSSLKNPVEGYRSALTRWMEPGSETRFLEKRLSTVVARVNRWYGFKLTGFREPFLLCKYRQGDGFEWHLDAGKEVTCTRKLSISLQLSDPADYEGGGLEFMPGGEIPFSRGRGAMIVFPSYLCHRVAPVTRGTRSALVAWVHGDPFR